MRLVGALPVLGLLLAVVGFGWSVLLGDWPMAARLLVAGGGVLFLVGLFLNLETVLRLVRRRSTLYGTNTVIVLLLTLGILFLVNFLVARHDERFDLTASGRFSLAPQSERVVRALEDEVEFLAFFKMREKQVEDLLKEYAALSPRVSYRFIDPDEEPSLARKYDIKQYGTIVIERGDRQEKVSNPTEEHLSRALIKLSREEVTTVYFLEGHGERDPQVPERNGYSEARKGLEDEQYQVETLNLVRADSIPIQGSVAVVAGPQTPPFPEELEKLKRYLNSGGRALLLLDPEPSVGLAEFLAEWGVQVGKDVVIDASGVGRLFGAGPDIPLVTSYPSHAITRDFRVMTFFPLARSVTPDSDVRGEATAQSLFQTSPSSWGEVRLENGRAKFDEGEDVEGPVSLGVAVTWRVGKEGEDSASSEERPGDDGSGQEGTSTSGEARLVVVGDSDFASNSYFGSQGNGDLFLNMVGWLAEEEELIAIRPKAPENRQIFMTATQTRMVFAFVVIVLPLLVVVSGLGVWWKRRK